MCLAWKKTWGLFGRPDTSVPELQQWPQSCLCHTEHTRCPAGSAFFPTVAFAVDPVAFSCLGPTGEGPPLCALLVSSSTARFD